MWNKYKIKLIGLLLLLSLTTSLNAATNHDFEQTGAVFSSISSSENNYLFFAEVDVNDQGNAGNSTGPLVIPGDDPGDKSEKKCMKVCEKWGEDCVINPRTGNRKCRRVCKLFGEECF